jgi:site-specific DNA-methyltransferase (adenine-specific)
MPAPITQNTLFYGDNLPILRQYVADESVDLVYLDPPFNSNRTYNVLFKQESGQAAESQLAAFEDTWHWNDAAHRTYEELIESGPPNVERLIRAFYEFIGPSQMMAYLVMMAARLVELRRVLKPTGSLYLHCDPTASHYLKLVLDTIFGAHNYRNEIVWKRTTAHSAAKRWGPTHDIILYYSKSEQYTWNSVYQSYSEEYLDSKYRYVDDKGKYRIDNLTAPGTRNGSSGDAWRGYDIRSKGMHWKVNRATVESLVENSVAATMTTQEKLDLLDANGYIYWPKGGQGFPAFKRYLGQGLLVQDIITDVSPINSQAAERLGYPTQKPLALLERILQASSNPGDVVLDPFCGCGTTIHAAQKLDRRWIGIDITHLSITLLKNRLKTAFPDAAYQVIGEPEDLGGARQLAAEGRYQFQWWALSLIGAQPLGGSGGREGKKGSDRGIDGQIAFVDAAGQANRVLVQVKSGKVKSGDVRDLAGTITREAAAIGVFLTLEEPTREMKTEAAAAGSYHSDWTGENYPRLQLLTIAEVLAGAAVKMPPTARSYKAARREKERGAEQKALFEE